MSEQLEVEFNKLNLKENDSLVIKVNTSGMSEEEAVKRLGDIREDEFIRYIEEKGNKVFVTYTGVDVQILRLQENDQLAVYVDTTGLEENKVEKYLDFIAHKLESLGDKVLIIPTMGNSPQLRVVKKEENNE